MCRCMYVCAHVNMLCKYKYTHHYKLHDLHYLPAKLLFVYASEHYHLTERLIYDEQKKVGFSDL